MKIRVTISGRGYHAAASVPETLELGAAATLADALASLAAQLPPERPLASSCLIVVDGQHVGVVGLYEDRPLSDGQELLLLAPVAGG